MRQIISFHKICKDLHIDHTTVKSFKLSTCNTISVIPWYWHRITIKVILLCFVSITPSVFTCNRSMHDSSCSSRTCHTQLLLTAMNSIGKRRKRHMNKKIDSALLKRIKKQTISIPYVFHLNYFELSLFACLLQPVYWMFWVGLPPATREPPKYQQC